MSRRSYFGPLVSALVLTLVSTAVRGSVRATYSDIMGCESGCDVAAVGFPVPFIVDYPGLSPVHSADLMGAILGLDRVHWPGAVTTFAVWTAASILIMYAAVWRRSRDSA